MSSMRMLALQPSGEVPQLGLGTWQSKSGGEVKAAVKTALDAGYRHFDCALIYQNEKEIGDAFAESFASKQVTREELFVTSKLWNTFHRPDLVAKGVQLSLDDLGLEYIDLYLIHWPMAYAEEQALVPKDDDGNLLFSEADYLDSYKVLEDLVDAGKLRAIGVSNFNRKQLQRVLDNCRIAPINLQIESHPYFQNQDLIDFATAKGITVTAYSPLANATSLFSKPDDPVLLQEPVLLNLAAKHGRSAAQVVIRWHIQRGLIVIPKSVKFDRLQQNIDVFGFTLSPEDMAVVTSLNRPGSRVCKPIAAELNKFWPFNEAF